MTNETVGERLVHEASIMVWLLDSERTNATQTDIAEYGQSFLGTKTFVDTHAALAARVREVGLWSLYKDIELPLIDVLERMKLYGMLLDVPYLNALNNELGKEVDQIVARIYDHAGSKFNINSPKQLGDVLFDTLELGTSKTKKTATGQRSTKESELEKLRDEHPIIEDILRYRELSKIISTYVTALPEDVGADGRVHSTLLQTGTTTGRMASRDPNLQNIPVRTDAGRRVRGAFIAPAGYQLVAIDYSQIELRIAAILSKDEALIDVFKNGEDIHAAAARRVFGVGAGEVTSNMRRQAKVINFGILYGMGVNALRTNLGDDTTRAEAQQFLNAYFESFPMLAQFLEDTKSAATTQGYTTTMFGRRRHFPALASNIPFMRAAAERAAINAPIQGTNGDCMRVAMRLIDEHITKDTLEEEVRMLMQVHDELLFEIKNDTIDTHVKSIKFIMESVLDGHETYGVPLVAEIKIGKNWYELEDYKIRFDN
jgi:DNA polymerase-1